MDRRTFLKSMVVASTSLLTEKKSSASTEKLPEFLGMLIDTTLCIGCRRCEEACAIQNNLPIPQLHTPVPDITRKLSPTKWTVVNAYSTTKGIVYVKKSCMHCNQPGCASACLVKAMDKKKQGPVIWHNDRCMGCRYCMLSCPYDIPKFQYDSNNPKVQKCIFCWDRLKEGKEPACVEACPQEAILFGTRRELLEIAKSRIYTNPDKYYHHIYGEKEVGGSSVLYLSSVPFDQLGFKTNFDGVPIPETTKEFLYGDPVALVILPALLLGINRATKKMDKTDNEKSQNQTTKKSESEKCNESIKESKNLAGKVRKDIWKFILSELKPKGKIFTPFNIITAPIILFGVILIIIRFAKGLGAVTNLSQDFPWGFWIGFDVVTGVAFAGGAYILTVIVYVLRVEKYHVITRATVLNGFLAYVFYAGALVFDLGRPWNIVNPIIGNSFGVSSVLFLVAWHFMLYMMAAFVEFSPAVAEWLGLKRARKILNAMTLGTVIFGFCVACLHQSGLGALFLTAKYKIHPLWYSEFIPILFVVSSVFAGLSVVIIEGTISSKVFKNVISAEHHKSHRPIVFGLARICAAVMFVYLFLNIIHFIHRKNWVYLSTPMGYWWLLEVGGFVILPMLLYMRGISRKNTKIVLTAAIMTACGIILNRLNVSIIAFKWDHPAHYYPSWMEYVITLTVVFAELWVFRWIVNRMPVMREEPAFAQSEQKQLLSEV